MTLLNRLNLICQYDRKRAKKATHVLAIVNGIDIRHAVNTYSKVSASIDLDDYKESEIERCINTFGYTIGRGRNFIDLNREEFKEDKVMLCCESLFEDMLPELLTNEQIKLLY